MGLLPSDHSARRGQGEIKGVNTAIDVLTNKIQRHEAEMPVPASRQQNQ